MQMQTDIDLNNNKILNLSDATDAKDAVNKGQLDIINNKIIAFEPFIKNYRYREIFGENFYDLTETSTFNININSSGVAIIGVNPNLHLGTNRNLSNYDRNLGMKMSNGHILLKNDINQSTSFTLFLSINFSEDIVIKFSGDLMPNSGYYPYYSLTHSNNRINIHESSSLASFILLTDNFKNKKIMLWICFNSSLNIYKFSIGNFKSSTLLRINNPINFKTKILRILYSGYVNKIGFVDRFINTRSLDYYRVILEEMRNGSYFE